MTDEESFLAAIQADLTNDLLRLVYADWLDDHDRPGGAFLRMECDLHAKDAAQGYLRTLKLPKAFLKAAERLPHDWLAVVSRVPIDVCGEDRFDFDFECPKLWESLPASIETPGVRQCAECKKDVHFCSNKEQAFAHAALGRCVALSLIHVKLRGKLPGKGDVIMGLPVRIRTPEDDAREAERRAQCTAAPKPLDPRGMFT